jgi:hypothetical protein
LLIPRSIANNIIVLVRTWSMKLSSIWLASRPL